MNMLGLRDLVLIAPNPSSLHHHQPQHHQEHPQPLPSQQQQHHHHNLPLPSPASLSVGLGFFPLVTTTPYMPPHSHDNNTNNNNNNHVHVQDQEYWNLKICGGGGGNSEVNSARKEDDHEGNNNKNNNHNTMVMGIESDHESGEFRVCLDCGNRAKRDCSYRRCRTCCKARAFDCGTHVKSTWIPASMRRGGSSSDGDGNSGSSKRLKALGNVAAAATSHSSNSNATTTKSFSLETSSCHQDASFKQSLPRHVRAPAVFRCHKVSTIGNGEDEFAYMATVHISGHVFKGFLYDHGVHAKNNEVLSVSELQLGSGNHNRECSSPIGLPYPASAC